MPIYEFACPKCRMIFSFLSKRVHPDHLPTCPKCGHGNLTKQVSRFAALSGAKEPNAPADTGSSDEPPMPPMDDPRVMRAMSELERDMEHVDENNPKHMAHVMRKMKDIMPPGTVPKELDVAIKRLEAGEIRRRSRKTWAMCWANSWAKRKGAVAGEVILATRDCMTTDY